MTAADMESAVCVQAAAFADLDRRMGGQPTDLTDAGQARANARHRHLLGTDPDGAWVATLDDRLVGAALALRRGDLWGLSLLSVDPTAQSHGIGRRLLDATLRYAVGCELAIIESSPDPRAIRSYGTSGFALYPQVTARGIPDLDRQPQDRRVRPGDKSDLELADSVDRGVRGAPHGPDHALCVDWSTMFVVDDRDGRGYCYVRDSHVYLLAATDDETAGVLLWRSFRHVRDKDMTVEVNHITAEQQWAIEICLAARLELKPDGPVFWRGSTPPRAYLPSGAFL